MMRIDHLFYRAFSASRRICKVSLFINLRSYLPRAVLSTKVLRYRVGSAVAVVAFSTSPRACPTARRTARRRSRTPSVSSLRYSRSSAMMDSSASYCASSASAGSRRPRGAVLAVHRVLPANRRAEGPRPRRARIAERRARIRELAQVRHGPPQFFQAVVESVQQQKPRAPGDEVPLRRRQAAPAAARGVASGRQQVHHGEAARSHYARALVRVRVAPPFLEPLLRPVLAVLGAEQAYVRVVAHEPLHGLAQNCEVRARRVHEVAETHRLAGLDEETLAGVVARGD